MRAECTWKFYITWDIIISLSIIIFNVFLFLSITKRFAESKLRILCNSSCSFSSYFIHLWRFCSQVKERKKKLRGQGICCVAGERRRGKGEASAKGKWRKVDAISYRCLNRKAPRDWSPELIKRRERSPRLPQPYIDRRLSLSRSSQHPRKIHSEMWREFKGSVVIRHGVDTGAIYTLKKARLSL